MTGMGLEVVGLEPDDGLAGRLPDWLYAVGDASGEAQLTHMGKYRARVVGERITALSAGCGPEPVPENVPVPQVVFTARCLVGGLGWSGAGPVAVGTGVLPLSVDDPGAKVTRGSRALVTADKGNDPPQNGRGLSQAWVRNRSSTG